MSESVKELFCDPPGSNHSHFSHRPSTYGFGCGAGVCAPSGRECVCAPGYVHSSFYFQQPDCWDPEGLRSAILITMSVILVFAFALCVWMAYRTTRVVRGVCASLALANASMALANLGLYLQGYCGLGASIFLFGGVSMILRATGMLVWSFMKPSFKMSGRNTARWGWLPGVLLPALAMVCFSVPLIAAQEAGSRGDFMEFNQRMGGAFLTLVLVPAVCALTPILILAVMFDKVFVLRSLPRSRATGPGVRGTEMSSSQGDVLSSGAQEGSPKKGVRASGATTAHPSDEMASQSLPRDKLSVLIWIIAKAVVLLGFVILTVCLYASVCAWAYRQVPLQALLYCISELFAPLYSLLIIGFIRKTSWILARSKTQHQTMRRNLSKQTLPGARTSDEFSHRASPPQGRPSGTQQLVAAAPKF